MRDTCSHASGAVSLPSPSLPGATRPHDHCALPRRSIARGELAGQLRGYMPQVGCDACVARVAARNNPGPT